MAADGGNLNERGVGKTERCWGPVSRNLEASERELEGVPPSGRPEPACHVLAGVDGGEWRCAGPGSS